MARDMNPAGRELFELRVPGDKSITHRALLLSAVASGTSRLRNLLSGQDPQATRRALRGLGIEIGALPRDGSEIRVAGCGLEGLKAPGAVIDCGNSGTTARLLLGLLAGRPFSATLTGDASLRSRPMRRVTEPLSRMGARFSELAEADRLPIRITGGELQPISYTSPVASAQVKSALLLAGLSGGVPVRVLEPVLSRDHTERMLGEMGAEVRVTRAPDGSAAVAMEPVQTLAPLDLDVPGDLSSAAFFVGFAALGRKGGLRIKRVGINPTRAGFLRVLARMGAELQEYAVQTVGGEPVADIVIGPASLSGTDIAASELPCLIDEVPVIAVLAATAAGSTRISGAAELRFKETDRLAVLALNLRNLGCDIEETLDGLAIQGTDKPLCGRVRCFGDHRIAMAFGILAAQPRNRIEIDEPEVVAISYPEFWTDLQRCAAALGAQ